MHRREDTAKYRMMKNEILLHHDERGERKQAMYKREVTADVNVHEKTQETSAKRVKWKRLDDEEAAHHSKGVQA